LRRYKAKRVKTRWYQERVGHLEPRFQREEVVPGEYFFGFYKSRQTANCTVLRAVVLTQYRRVTDGRTDGQTDGIAVASTALPMRALRRAVITYCFYLLPVLCFKTVHRRLLYVCIYVYMYLRAEVHPTLDPYAEAFLIAGPLR